MAFEKEVTMGKWMDLAKKVIAEKEAKQQEPPAATKVFPGLVVRLYRTRPDCLAAGFCKQVTHEDCDLYPVTKAGKLSGFCRKRTPGG